MEILITHRIRKKELNGTISGEARKLFTKLKGRPLTPVGRPILSSCAYLANPARL